MTCMLNILTLLVIAGCLLFPDSAYAADYPGWYLDTSCNTLGPRIRQSYANALSMSQAVVNLNKNNDPNFNNLMSMMLGNRVLNPALVADAVARHQNILDKLSQEVTGKQPIYRNWDGNVIFYCDKSRYQDKTVEITQNGQKQSTLVHYDKTFGLDWPHNDPNWGLCFRTGIPSGVAAVTLQYTMQNFLRPDMIQLCGWWLTYTYGWLPPSLFSVKPGWVIDLPASVRDILGAQHKVDMDVYSTLDRYILKHLLLTFPAKTAVGVAVNTGVDGWTAAVAAADRGGNTEAENLSWLGVGAWMIQRLQIMPTAAGGVVSI